MKTIVLLVPLLALVPLSRLQAAPEQPRATSATALPAVAAPAQEATSPKPPRRSVIIDSGNPVKPRFTLTASYRVVDKYPKNDDRCLQGTGSRVKRKAGTGVNSGCAGAGRVLLPPDS